jgi:hypothetical protein
VALVALPLAGLSLLGGDRTDGPPSAAGDAALVQRTDPARTSSATRALGLAAVLVATAGAVVVVTADSALPATVRSGHAGRRGRAAGRGPPLLPR